MATYETSSTAQIHALVNGVNFPPVKSWTTFEGGDPQAASSQLHPGAGINAVAVPGPVTRTNVTVTRPYTAEMHAFVPALENTLNGRMSASYTLTDANGNPNGPTITRAGILKELQIPKWDAASGTPAMLGLIMECDV